ncbi:MAG: methyltransferase family protein [Gemmatimonadota bacterium]
MTQSRPKFLTPQVLIYSALCIGVGLGPWWLGMTSELLRPVVWLFMVLGYRWLEQFGYSPRSSQGNRRAEWLFYAIYMGFSGSILLPAVEYAFAPRPLSVPLMLVGVGFAGLGAFSRYLSVKTIGRHFSTHVEVRPGHELVDSGIMSLIRHPGYAGAMAFTLGGALILHSFWSLVYICAFYWVLLLIRIGYEEQELGERLVGYRDYMKRTKRLIPWVF